MLFLVSVTSVSVYLSNYYGSLILAFLMLALGSMYHPELLNESGIRLKQFSIV